MKLMTWILNTVNIPEKERGMPSRFGSFPPCPLIISIGATYLELLQKFRPVRDLNPRPLRYWCSTLPTELTSQLGAGHEVGSK